MATANQIRQTAIEVAENIATIKTAADALKTDVDAIQAVTSTWTLNELDAALPTEADVKAQVEAYEALNTVVSKPANNISDAIEAVKAVV